MTSTELVRPAVLLDVRTGELVEATPDKAAELLIVARQFRSQILDSVKACEYVLLEESKRQGTKTLHYPGGTATITGGSELDWDFEVLNELRAAGLPEERYDELVVATVTFKVNAAVSKQLASANPDYAQIIERARGTIERPWRVNIR
jgi:hypothetical protein